MPFYRHRLRSFPSMVLTSVIVCKSEKECILSEFNCSVLVFLIVVFFSLHVCDGPFPATE